MIDTIIFDVGRVLVQWDYSGYMDRFHFDAQKKKRITEATFENPYWGQFDRGVLTAEELLNHFISRAPEYEADIRSVFEGCEDTITLFPYAVPLVKRLKEQGYRLYILSNYSEYLFEKTRRKMEFLPYMDGTLFSYSCHLIKPEREIFELLTERFQIIPEHAVFLDDMLPNIRAAKDFGIHGIHFTGYEDALKNLRSLGVTCV